MVREGLRRSARASVSASNSRQNSRLPSPASDESDLDIPGDDSEDEYVGNGASASEGEAMDVDLDEAAEASPELEEDEDDDFGAKAKAKVKKTPTTKRKRVAAPRTPKTPRTPRRITGDIPGRRSTAAARNSSTLNAFPPAYQDLLLNSAATLVRKADEHKPAPASFRVPPFPPGPLTPFKTHLNSEPGAGVADIVVVDDPPHTTQRRDHMRDISKRVAIIPPWDAWEGEGWWPEMVEDNKGKGKAVDGPMPGWQWRSEVRLGLDDVGRYHLKNVLSASVGKAYASGAGKVVLNLYSGTDNKRHELDQFATLPLSTTISSGFLLCAGGPVWGLDWCPYPDRLGNGKQYVAVSTIPSYLEPTTGGRCDASVQGSIQIWSVPFTDDNTPPSSTQSARCEVVLCLDGGPVSDVKWMPIGAWDELGDDGSRPKLGILAAVQLDGSTSFYSVPHPNALRPAKGDGPTYVRAQPLLKLAIDDSSCTCIQWLSGKRIAIGLANGHLAVYDVLDALTKPTSEPLLPSIYTTLALSAIRSIATGRCPPVDGDGTLDYTGEALYIAFGSFDGTTGVVDLRDPNHVIELNRSRLPCMATAWSHQVGVPLYADVDYMILLAQLRAALGPATYYLTPHRGPVWEIGTSDYHTMVASASSDGSVLISNCGMGFYRRKQGGMLFQRLYEIDYDEHTGEYRMAQDFMAESTGLEEATSKANHKSSRTKGSKADAQAPTTGDPATVKTGAWRQNVGVHRVVWHSGSGIARAGWIASGGWSGIVRVENLRGQWLYQAQ